MRLVFLGTPEAAVPSLEALVEAGHEVALVITRPDRRRGRGTELSASPVKVAATRLGVPVGHRLGDVNDVEVERGVVVAYGVIVPEPLLDKVPMLNVHFSLLPRWRGAAPVQRAILAGDQDTGVSIISLEATLDTGPVHLERRVSVDDKTAQELTGELAQVGAVALLEVLGSPALLDHPHAQVGEVTYAEKITKELLHLTPEASTQVALRTVRLGGAYFFVGGKRVVVLSARASDDHVPQGVVALREDEVVVGSHQGSWLLEAVRPEGSTTMTATAWWRGLRAPTNEVEWS
ncbi:MAG: fmt [Acidimicrobiaceae bacterium]|nr:fmt [Acidimicrobiaceae bacterium]